MHVLDVDSRRDDARTQETVLRLRLRGASGDALAAIVEEHLRRKAQITELALTEAPGRHTATSELARLEVDRADDRLVALLNERDASEPRRRWTTEIVVDRPAATLDVRVTVDQPLSAPYAARQTPAFLARALANPDAALVDVRALTAIPTPLDEAQLEAFVALVNNRERELPVLVVSVPGVVDAALLARRLAGAAHVFSVGRDESFQLTNRVGKLYSVFDGGVRMYPAGFRWTDSPRSAPLWLGSRLAQVRDGLPADERVVRAVLAPSAASCFVHPMRTIAEVDREARLVQADAAPSVRAEVAQLSAELETLRTQRDLALAELERYTEETVLLWEPEYERFKAEREDAEESERAARASEYRWRAELEAARSADAAGALHLDDGVGAPADAAAFVAFVTDRYGGRISVLPAARRFYRDGEYEDRENLVRVLDAIATDYYDVGRGVEGARARWNAACEALHLKHGPSATETGATDEHKLRLNGEPRLMYHVRSNGTTFDPRRMLYVGFVFDEATQQVVLGRLPSKPPTMADHT